MTPVESWRTKAEVVFANCDNCSEEFHRGDVRRSARRHAERTGHVVRCTVEHSLIYQPRGAR